MEKFENSNVTKEITDFHFLRYEELPNIDLYMDQLISLIEDNLNIFSNNDKEKLITPSMVNNYVKQKLISPPVKKKYNKNHIAYLIIVCVAKQLFSISEVADLISIQIETYPIKVAYNYFATKLEGALKIAFLGKEKIEDAEYMAINEDSYEAKLVKLATISFANKIYVQKYLTFLEKEKVD